MATRVQSTNSVPVVVERAQYWPYSPPEWYEAHNSFGVTQPGTHWGLAEGQVGARQRGADLHPAGQLEQRLGDRDDSVPA